jgi:hypothetical protein
VWGSGVGGATNTLPLPLPPLTRPMPSLSSSRDRSCAVVTPVWACSTYTRQPTPRTLTSSGTSSDPMGGSSPSPALAAVAAACASMRTVTHAGRCMIGAVTSQVRRAEPRHNATDRSPQAATISSASARASNDDSSGAAVTFRGTASQASPSTNMAVTRRVTASFAVKAGDHEPLSTSCRPEAPTHGHPMLACSTHGSTSAWNSATGGATTVSRGSRKG